MRGVRAHRKLTWITVEPGRPISVAALVAVADSSTAALTRLFRRHLGTSPPAWALRARIRVARELITTLPMAQIARRVGINDAYYFSRQLPSGSTRGRFRRHAAMSPTTSRRRERDTPGRRCGLGGCWLSPWRAESNADGASRSGC